MDKKEIINHILRSEFQRVREILKRQNKENILSVLLNISFDTKNIAVYLFLEDWILEEECGELLSVASVVLSVAFAWVPGAYHIAFRHLKRAIEMEPNNLDYKEMILEYHEIPERLLSLDQAIEYAEQVAEVRPESEIAQDFLKRRQKIS